MAKYLTIITGLLLLSCNQSSNRDASDVLLVEAYGSKLYLSDIANQLDSNITKSDSLNTLERIITDWTMEQILFQESKKNIDNKSALNQLVEDYKKDLYINALDEKYLAESLDTVISQVEIDTFIKWHKEEFALPETILRYLFVKVPEDKDIDTLKNYWKTEDLLGLKYFISLHKGLSLLNVNKWYYLSELKNLLPESIYKKISLKKTNSYSGIADGSKYYVKILEIIKDTDEVPVSFLNERVRHRILQQRIKVLLKDKKTILYNNSIKSKQIKIYSNTHN